MMPLLIPNTKGRKARCDECGDGKVNVVEIRQEDYRAWICQSCLQKALDILQAIKETPHAD